MKFRFIAPVAFGVALCACAGPIQAPIVDMTGIDQAKYNKDVADCYQHVPGFSTGNYITKCMEKKGYHILVGF